MDFAVAILLTVSFVALVTILRMRLVNLTLESELKILRPFLKKMIFEHNRVSQRNKRTIERYRSLSDELKTSDDRLRIILDNVIDSVIKIDKKGNIKSFNLPAQKAFGYSQKEALQLNISDLISNEYTDDYIDYLRNHSQNRRFNFVDIDKQIMAKDKNGDTFPVEVGMRDIIYGDEEMHIIILSDITDRNKAERQAKQYTESLEWAHYEMKKARNDAEKANHSKSMFLANMSHEIRTPLNSINGMTELLLNTDLSAKQQKYTTYIYKSGEILLSLICDILDFSKIEAGEMTLEEIPTDLRALTKETVEMFEEDIKNKGVKITTRYERGLPLNFIIDPTRIKQIIINLVGNAIKFTDKGKIEVSVTAAKILKTKAKLRFEISDTGVGISAEQIYHIFDTFAQADISTTREFGGTGLGLAICRKLVNLMGGKIGVNSEIKKGSTFWFELDLKMQKNK